MTDKEKEQLFRDYHNACNKIADGKIDIQDDEYINAAQPVLAMYIDSITEIFNPFVDADAPIILAALNLVKKGIREQSPNAILVSKELENIFDIS